LTLQLPKGTQVDFPIEDIHDFKQVAYMVDFFGF
jgi:hypothetical protein